MFLKKNGPGISLTLAIAIPSWFIGRQVPVIGSAVAAILLGMAVTMIWPKKDIMEPGIKFVSKKVLEWAVVLLGFGMNLNIVFKTGLQSLPIILCTISVSLMIAYILHRLLKTPTKISVLVGVGSSICGGSAIAATAPVIDADDDEVAQAISVIFFFNIIAAVMFPVLGQALGFSTVSGDAFGLFAGTAINDTSSVTAAASAWDSRFGLGSATLDRAVTVKLTRTLAIIPITLILAFVRTRKARTSGQNGSSVNINKIFPYFILFFIGAALVTTICINNGVPSSAFDPLKELSKFMITLAMAAIGLKSNIVKLIKTGGKPIIIGASCWAGITCVSLILQNLLGLM